MDLIKPEMIFETSSASDVSLLCTSSDILLSYFARMSIERTSPQEPLAM